jgi:hypothetical protein
VLADVVDVKDRSVFDVDDICGRCRGSRADSGGPGGPFERRPEKWLMFMSNSGITSPSVGFDHRVTDTGAPSLLDAPVAESEDVAGLGDASAQAGRICPAAVGIKGRAKYGLVRGRCAIGCGRMCPDRWWNLKYLPTGILSAPARVPIDM